MKSILNVCLVVLLLVVSACSAYKVTPTRPADNLFSNYYYNNETKKLEMQTGNTTEVLANNKNLKLAVSSFVDNTGMEHSGWDTVWIEMAQTYLAEDKMAAYYAAGYVEGFETQHRIYENYYNLYPPSSTLTEQANPRVKAWIEEQIKYVNETSLRKMKNNLDPNQQFWIYVQAMMQQMQGMVDGYQAAAPAGNDEHLSYYEVYMVGFNFELFDVQFWANKTGNATDPKAPAPRRKSAFAESHCSALVRDTKDDLFMAHDTWSGFSTMLRQYKTYAFERTIAMSSYPGTLHSGDDWYMLDNGLTVQETTNDNYNMESYPWVLNHSVPEFIRVMTAHRVADTGLEWTQNFCIENSGTYNNQYMIVNMNYYDPNASTALGRVPSGTLWIVEQMPNYCQNEDVSDFLREHGYWASYNLPAIPIIQQVSGTDAMEAEYGSFFSWEHYSRARIFRRNASMIHNLEDMKAIMRYNNFRNDEFSLIPNCSGTPDGKCDPAYSSALTIASRFDLNTKGNASTLGPNWQYLDFGLFGAIDSKIVAWSQATEMIGHLIAGPTYQPQYGIPEFSWAPYPDEVRMGIPDTFNFEFKNTTALLEAPKASPTHNPPRNKFWILGVVAGIIVVCCVAAVIYKKRQQSEEGEGEYTPLDDRNQV